MPVYVLEFLLGKYCASDVPSSIEAGLAVVNQTLQDNFIRPDESELAKARVKQKGEYRLIDKVDVRLLASEDKFWAHLQNFNDKFVHIPENLVYRYNRLLQGGAWCQLDLLYNPAEEETPQAALLHPSAETDPGRRLRPRRVRSRDAASSVGTPGSTSSRARSASSRGRWTCGASSSPCVASFLWRNATST